MSDMKEHATVEITKEEFTLLQGILDEAYKKHRGAYKRIIESGYGKSSTEQKALKHLYKSDEISALESINGGDSWNSNPWVWVVEFKRIEKPVTTVPDLSTCIKLNTCDHVKYIGRACCQNCNEKKLSHA